MSHARDFSLESNDEELAQALIYDYRKSKLNDSDRALCDYAVKLTFSPENVGQADIEQLRATGFSDEQITIAVQVISYFNYINRVADGLGVDPELWMEKDESVWREKKAVW